MKFIGLTSRKLLILIIMIKTLFASTCTTSKHTYAHLNTYIDHNAAQNHQLHQQSPIFAKYQASAAVSPGINQEPQQLLEYKRKITPLPLKDTTTKPILSLDVGVLNCRSSPLSTNPSFIKSYNLSSNQE